MNKKPSFEDNIDIIDAEIAKRRGKWNLNSLAWMDFDDVAQIIRIHIYKKWSQYNPERPLLPWLNVIITHQIKNLIRNVYGNFSRPCLRCDAAEGDTGCKIYTTQCASCPLYAYWQKKKQPAQNVRVPVSIENHENEVHEVADNSSDVTRHAAAIHAKMKTVLKPVEYRVYDGLFIRNLDEEAVASELGYISNEQGRPPGYKQIKNIRKQIITKVRKIIATGEVDIY